MGKYIVVSNTDELYHHGIKGQKWGVRRFQNEDGSLTPAGVKRYQTDAYGNMTKKGAANYYRDIYNEAKAIGYRGQGVHDYVRQHFNNEGEYQAFVDNYRKYKAKKAVTGAAAGAIGIAATTALTGAAVGAGVNTIAKANRRLVNNALIKGTNYGQPLQGMNAKQLMEYSKSKKHLGSNAKETINNILSSKVAERAAEEQMIRTSKINKRLYKSMGSTDELKKAIEYKYENLNKLSGGNSRIDKMYRKYREQDLKAAEKAYLKRAKKDAIFNFKMASLDQATVETGKSAIQNRMNAFSNSLFGQIASGAGTTLGAMYVNAQVEASRRAIANVYDEDTANRIAPGSLKIKEYKDKSSALTMPQRMDKAWENSLKGDTKPKTNSDDDDSDDDDEKKKKN